jgi:uncharacterized membrane protein
MAGEIMTTKKTRKTRKTIKPNNSIPTSSHGFDDQRMETMMGRLLQAGVLLASTVVLIGGGLDLKTNLDDRVNYRTFHGEPSNLRDLPELLPLLAKGDPTAIIQFGILLLIATPIARVMFAVVGFAIERDRLYIVVSLLVLAVLAFGMLHP